MVELNLTIVCELVLFLLFLWVANVLIFRPTLRVMDTRKEKVAEDENTARADTNEAQSCEARYVSELAATRRVAAQRVDEARWNAQEERLSKISERRRQGDEKVTVVREEARKQIMAERERFAELAPNLADVIADRLGLGRNVR